MDWTDRKVGGEILTALTELNRREIMQWIKCVAHHHIPPLSVHGGDMNQINIGNFHRIHLHYTPASLHHTENLYQNYCQ